MDVQATQSTLVSAPLNNSDPRLLERNDCVGIRKHKDWIGGNGAIAGITIATPEFRECSLLLGSTVSGCDENLK